ncbi:MAG: ECF transporter S component [Clostridiales bacterium]|nr:ECF transporter S component [Candidatus Equinaster intestinalis]
MFMTKEKTRRLVLAALFLAIGMVLPLITLQLKEIGDSLLPMHLAVMLCGIICGQYYGAAVGFILPFLRGVIFGMPPLYPNAVWMAFELATYGFIIGLLYKKLPLKNNLLKIYISLITSMIAGRIIWSVVKSVLLGVAGKSFTIALFWAQGFADAIPGIILQLILIPIIIRIIENYGKKGA